MTDPSAIPEPGAGDLFFLPLGGAGEIGMNLNLYGHDGRWLMVDLGITFNDPLYPGVDVMMPDPSFIESRRDALAGLVLTHAHEDHLGAVPELWRRLRCPVYATPFTAAFLRFKLREVGLADKLPLTEVPLGGRVQVGPFDVTYIGMTHSIPESNALAIRTRLGTVLHTGDWKLDPEPLVGAVSDEAALRALGEEGVLALVGDSTNALVPGEAGSESGVRKALTELFAGKRHRILVGCFASNIARLDSIVHAAAANDRRVALVGRSLWRMTEAARQAGYLRDLPPFVAEEEVGFFPRDRIVIVCTGSQGEPRAALPRIAAGDHPHVVIEPGDIAVFSSRVIPGNEKAIGALQNRLAARGIEVITDRDAPIHVSGHPARDELTRMYQWARPRIAVPVHGEERHMRAHADLARACQVSETPLVRNGDMLRLAPGKAEIVGHVPAGRLARDGRRLIAIESDVLRERSRALHNGSAVATLVIDRRGRLRETPRLSTVGLYDPDSGNGVLESVLDEIDAAIAMLPAADAREDEAVQQAARRAVRRAFHRALGKRPVTDIHIVRL